MEDPNKNSDTDKKNKEIKAKALLLKIAIMNRKKQIDKSQKLSDPNK